MVCTDQELWWWIREGRCALKQSLNRILDDEREGTSNVRIIFIVPSRSDLLCSTCFPTVVLHLSRSAWGLPEIQEPPPGQQTWDSRATWGVWSHQVVLGLGLAPGGCAQELLKWRLWDVWAPHQQLRAKGDGPALDRPVNGRLCLPAPFSLSHTRDGYKTNLSNLWCFRKRTSAVNTELLNKYCFKNGLFS